MHDGQLFVLAIIAISVFGGTAKMWVRAKAGLPPEDREERRSRRRSIGATDLAAERQVLLLSTENEKLTGKIGRLEERLAVLERIATDPAERTAREIEALRDR